MRSRRSRLLLLALTVGLVLLTSACAKNAPQDTLAPDGELARDIDGIQNWMFAVAGLVFVVVEGAILFIVFRFRQRKGHEDDVPYQRHGNTILELGWTIIPAAMLVPFAFLTIATLIELNEKPGADRLDVTVYGQQWWWAYEYPAQDGIDEKIVTANELVVPAGRPVYLTLRSRDVIHSFWAPKLNGKRDVVPGRTHHWTIETDLDDAGKTFDGQCVEFCGLSHANMRLRVKVLAADDFAEWVQGQEQDARRPTTKLARDGLEQFKTLCTSCHQINGVNETPKAAQVSGAAPNLTHLMSRSVFAGGLFDTNRAELEAWLRDPSGKKPMEPDDERGMPNLNLTQEQIDQLVAYLLTLD
jgi:cytochrome c oxidase subunit II